MVSYPPFVKKTPISTASVASTASPAYKTMLAKHLEYEASFQQTI